MVEQILERLGLRAVNSGLCAGRWIDDPDGEELTSYNPTTGQPIARVRCVSRAGYDQAVERAVEAFGRWRLAPPPERGHYVRRLGEALRERQRDLGALVSMEVGKIRSEGEGEVQEMIDMCDFSVGLSRQLHGLTIASERPEHRMFEQWQPLGPVGTITAFNFPVAVWAWNATLAAVCGDTCLWKPSPLAPLTSIAVQHIVNQVMRGSSYEDVFILCLGAGTQPGPWMAQDNRLPLISATGSCEMGRSVGQQVGARLGKTLLELGGNNAIIVTESADLELALRAVLFAAVGTAGQRCTTLRRLFVHTSVADALIEKLLLAYQSIPIGDPLDEGNLMGPLITQQAVERMMDALEAARSQGGELLCGGRRLDRPGFFVEPAVVQADPSMQVVGQETFAPILYVMRYESFDEALAWHNSVQQGLSSAVFTGQLRTAERFLSPEGSDCGIANVNIGTSGAEIGGAFGGEKDTGGGREAGSDSWKAYMRRQTCTINYGTQLPLAQGVKFDLR